MNNSGGGGRAGRGPALEAKLKRKRKKQHQKAYDQHKYDGTDLDNLEAEPA